DEAVAQAVRERRQAYPKSSDNCRIQSEDQLIALWAAGREKTSPRSVEIDDEYGRGEQAADYRVMRARELRDDNGDSAGVVVSSSGYEQEGWNVLENDQMIIASNRNGTYRLRSI
ncbi:class II glutamine amidotransferase, partial [Bifidobacterium longum]